MGRLLTVEELAELLRWHPEHARRQVRSGAFPGAVRDGRRWLVPEADVTAWLRARQPFRAPARSTAAR